MKTVIDPPQGNLYGFPKVIPKSRLLDWQFFLVENGYPEENLDLPDPVRFFCVEDEETMYD